ncbi:hypothetical protein Cch01nite_21750 [Cellulomonas chitinilytica]|uniref:Uncharacterized protein n=1 Tax=Cellulomonas chitinilytica TaxID=398759 RepID=A0A919P4H2_9CELL|nr:hypothetical protein [Cellulomonas chitinilytica]GIG21451.1 hypothetical protein Cch01nite_21750 [Cellulomonas chitinilytica]
METVPTDTPALRATSVIDGRRSARPRVVVDIDGRPLVALAVVLSSVLWSVLWSVHW